MRKSLIVALGAYLKLVFMLQIKHTPDYSIIIWELVSPKNVMDITCIICHEQFIHEASQSNYGACLSAAGHRAEFMYFAFADVEMLQFNSS
jgi:hypothetical protein